MRDGLISTSKSLELGPPPSRVDVDTARPVKQEVIEASHDLAGLIIASCPTMAAAV